MFRHAGCRLAAMSSAFSSAAFTGNDDGSYERFQEERQRLQQENTYTPSSRSSGLNTSPFINDHSYDHLKRPTADTYRAMSDDELVELLRTRERQVHQLRSIYENFHYEADKHFRKMVFDYHDKTLQLSQVHGKMQEVSFQINREVLKQLREEQETYTRDTRMAFIFSSILTFWFWIWVRRHYIALKELEEDPDAIQRAAMAPSVTGIGSYSWNCFSSSKRSARSRETSWEKEVRESREKSREGILENKLNP
ncbi:unnamed protein product [Phytomonas sp. Hart1]|nr:unnamed protein product [Phytomonas sp. Hart1]|eukprot:CCW70300.1 unnamed protein product [Phytomonas sp. isolate Hart1]